MSVPPKEYVVSYLRFSTKRQARGSTVERQETLLNAFLAANPHLTVLDQFADRGVSGFTGKHAKVGAMSRLIALLDKGKLPMPLTITVESIDRLSREGFMDAFGLFSDLIGRNPREGEPERKVTIMVLDTNVRIDRETMNKDAGRIYEVVGAMMRSHNESQRRSDVVRAAWRIRIRGAIDFKYAVKGYVGPPWVKVDEATNRYAIGCQQTAGIVRSIFQWRVEGLRDHAIAKRLNERGVPVFRAHTPKGKIRQGWYPAYVGAILANRQVLGEHTFKGYPTIDGYFPEIISPELFHQAEMARKPREHRPGRVGRTLSNLFTHMAKCAHCGGNMEMTRNRASTPNGPEPIKYLMCSSRKRRYACDGTGMINYPKLEDAILGSLDKLPWSDIISDENPENPVPALDTAIARIEIEIKNHAKNRERAKTLILRGAEFEEEFTPIFTESLKALKAAERLLGEVTAERQKVALEWGSRPSLNATAMECRDRMNVLSDAEKFNVRCRLSDALSQMITRMECDAPGKEVRVRINDRYTLTFSMPIRRGVTTRGGFGMSAVGMYRDGRRIVRGQPDSTASDTSAGNRHNAPRRPMTRTEMVSARR